jgi:hypothetical protein
MASLALQVGLHLALELFAGLAQALEALASEDICPYTLTMRIDWDPIKAAANLREQRSRLRKQRRFCRTNLP